MIFIENSKAGEIYICWAAIYSLKLQLASKTASIRPLNRAQALATMSLSMVVNTSVMEAIRPALMLRGCLLVCLSNSPVLTRMDSASNWLEIGEVK